MSTIGGNTDFKIQKMTSTQNDFGEDVTDWFDVYEGKCFIDMMSGEANRTFIAKIEQSSHVLLTDYFDYKSKEINAENCRIVTNGDVYELTYIDDPMNLHEHLEIFLKFLGGV